MSDNMSDDMLLVRWQKAKAELNYWKKEEMELRLQVIKNRFGELKEGTTTLELGNKWELKGVGVLTYELDDNDKVIPALNNLPKELQDRIVSWTPKLSVKEYRHLTGNEKGIIDSILTIKPGSPQLNLIEPK